MSWTREERYRPLAAISAEEFNALEQRVATAPWRQTFHIQPPTGLLNDPNGFCYDGSTYHLFYQWFPLGAVHGLKYWRYTQSTDLVEFVEKGIAIAPDFEQKLGGYDSHGAYSGSALANADGTLTLAYTGNHRTEDWVRVPYQLLADFDPATMTVTRHQPFMSDAPAGYTEHVRDPKMWRVGDDSDKNADWYAIIGAQREDKTGCAILVKNGEMLGELKTQLADFGYMWECPDYFTIDGTDVMTICPQGLPVDGEANRNVFQSGYVLGKLDIETLTFEHGEFVELDHGFDFYAQQTCTGENGQQVMVGWMGLPDMAYPSDKDEWQGCMSLPRVLTIEDGKLKQRPVAQMTNKRGNAVKVADSSIEFATGELVVENKDNQAFEVNIFADETHRTQIKYDGEFVVFDRSQSGELPQVTLETVPTGKTVDVRKYPCTQLDSLRIFVDSSSLEIFINDGETVMTGRVFAPEEAVQLSYQGKAELTAYPYQ